jgi:hypothetical protein
MLPPDAEIYRRGGWNFLMGKNLNPALPPAADEEAAGKKPPPAER